MSKVRAKFKVCSVTRMTNYSGQEVQAIKLLPVSGGSDENRVFYMDTPSGSIDLTTVNVEVGRAFDLGGEFYVDFTRAV